MFDNMYRSGECYTAMGFTGIIFIIIGILSIIVVPDNSLLVLGVVCIVIGVLLTFLLCCYSGTDITGHTIPRDFQLAYEKSLEDSQKRKQNYYDNPVAQVQTVYTDTVNNSLPIQLNQVQPSQ